MKMFDSQKSPFAAKVYFFTPQEIRGILSALLAKYYRAANKEDKDDEDDDQQGSKVESFGEMRDTLTAFTALFCDQEQFESEDSASNYLQQAKSENDQKILEELVGWAVDVVNRFLEGNDFVIIEKSTPEELLWALQPYTYQVGGMDGEGEVSPWPLVSVINFGLDHPLLNEGVVFVDSPGLSDANAVRSRNAIKHHRKCTHKIVVAEIGRAEADANVRKNLELSHRTRGSGNTLLVLTHGDSIDPETEVTGTPGEKKRVAKLDADIKALRNQKQKKNQERQKLRQDDRDDIDEEIKSIGTDMRQKQAEKEFVKLGMRNRKVISKMQELYKKLTQDPKPLAAIAVGNKVYSQYQAGFSDDEKPYLSVKDTNIPTLRHRLYTMPVEGRYNDTLHFAEVQLPTLINSIELYCSQRSSSSSLSQRSKCARWFRPRWINAKNKPRRRFSFPCNSKSLTKSSRLVRSALPGRSPTKASLHFSERKGTRRADKAEKTPTGTPSLRTSVENASKACSANIKKTRLRGRFLCRRVSESCAVPLGTPSSVCVYLNGLPSKIRLTFVYR
jgi:hypothetical protein